MSKFAESTVEEAALEWLRSLGWATLYGPTIAAGGPAAERADPVFRDTVLVRCLRETLVRLNPDLPPERINQTVRAVTENSRVLKFSSHGCEVE